MTNVHVIPCLEDNYAYVLKTGDRTYLIDAPEAAPIIQFLDKQQWKLDGIFLTHHHGDHVDGNLELREKYKCKTYSSSYDISRIKGVDFGLSDSDVCEGFSVMILPGHTLGHTALYHKDKKIIFTGDTLFSAGCGRLFEGSPQQMFDSLGRIKELPQETQMYCGHEYSKRNLEFVLKHDSNDTAKARYDDVVQLRNQNKPTVPTTLGMELNMNPFLRANTVDDFIRLRTFKKPVVVIGKIEGPWIIQSI